MRQGRVNQNALALRRYRKANPDYAEREKKRVTARWEAMQALARRHPAEYRALYEAELAYAGLDRGGATEKTCACGGTIRRPSGYGRWPSSCEGCASPAALRRRRERKDAAAKADRRAAA